ncbi:MAG: hypothetical protein HUU21_11410 [Polyangiaceae bacterium]|nr:hypothetical protein [Polyangiaceae bacterium]
MHLGPVCAIGVIGVITKTCGAKALEACGTPCTTDRRAIGARSLGLHMPAREVYAHQGTVRRFMTRGVGSCA